MTTRVILFSQPGCLSCELLRVYLEATEIVFEERDIGADEGARRDMADRYHSDETPTVVIVNGEAIEVVTGFDPVRLEQLLQPASSSNAVTKA